MFDIMKYAQPKEKLDLADGIDILSDTNYALDEIGKKLKIMQKLAYYAANPNCDPVKRMEMNMLFKKLGQEIDEWAQTSTGGIQLLNAPLVKNSTNNK